MLSGTLCFAAALGAPLCPCRFDFSPERQGSSFGALPRDRMQDFRDVSLLHEIPISEVEEIRDEPSVGRLDEKRSPSTKGAPSLLIFLA